MRTTIPTKIDYKLSDIIDELAQKINQLDPDVAGEDDEIHDLEEAREKLMEGLVCIEDMRRKKYHY